MRTIAILLIVAAVAAACTQPPASLPPVPQTGPSAAAQPAASTPNPPTVRPTSATNQPSVAPAVEPTPSADPDVIMLTSPIDAARATPTYFGAPPEPLPAGKVEDAPPAVPVSEPGERLLYLDQTLHIWRPDEGRDENLGWPSVAVECAWLAPDGHTFYFSDDEGVKRTDLAQPESPQLLLPHYTTDKNPARNRRFCVAGQSDSGQLLLVQARDQRWYQWGVLDPASGAVRAVESPFGPPNEPWYCPGGAVWGQGATLFVSGYSVGACNQAPGLYTTQYGQPLAPTAVLTGTLPALGARPVQRAGAWQLTRSPDGQHVAFWFDQDWASQDGQFLTQALYVVDADGANPRKLSAPVAGRNGPPAWSADSRSLYYAAPQAFDVLDPQPWQIHRIDLANGQDQVVAELPARFIILAETERGGKLLLLTLTDAFDYQMHLLDLTTGEMENGPARVAPIGWLNGQ